MNIDEPVLDKKLLLAILKLKGISNFNVIKRLVDSYKYHFVKYKIKDEYIYYRHYKRWYIFAELEIE